jgi:3-oxoacyl-[acyl-carrier protein] reductase
MDFGLKDKNALVMASSGGLGRGVAEALAAEGAGVFVTGRSADKLADCVQTIRERGGRAESIAADLADPFAPDKIFEAASKAFGTIDILVTNSGGPPPGLPSAVTTEDWLREFSRMALPVFALTRSAVAGMRARGWGRIIACASSGVVEPIPNLPLSNGLRLSIVGWMKSLAAEVAAEGVTVNVLIPGRVDTDRIRQLDAGAAAKQNRSLEDVQRESIGAIPAARYGTIAEFAAVAAFLASRPASYVTGSLLRVDGGMIRSF